MVVDSLVKLIAAQGAEGLVLPSDGPPSLEKGGELQDLSMPPLGGDVLETALEELTLVEQREQLAKTGSLTVRHKVDDKSYDVSIERRSDRLRLTFRLAGKGAASVSAESPPPAKLQQRAERSRLDEILSRAELENASDILLSLGRVPRIRVGAELLEVGAVRLDADELWALVDPVFDDRARGELERHGSVDLAIEIGRDVPRRYRLNLFQQQSGLAVALRPIRSDVPTLRSLGLPEDFHRLTEYRSGLVLMTGATGSGKSTTLVALIEHINRTAAKHVITLEDPIEYAYGSGRALIHQREVGRHVDRFDTGLRAALRESPDVILLGEMRDRETISAALTAAETGHLVLSTLHCDSANMAISRIIDIFPEHQHGQVRMQLAGALRAVVTQLLLPSTRPPARVAVFEKLVANTAVATKIREGRVHQLQSEIQKGQSDGMVPLEVPLARLVRSGRLALETALSVSSDPQSLRIAVSKS